MSARSSFDPQPLIAEYGEYVNPSVGAKLLGVSRRTLLRNCERGDLPLYRVGSARAYRIKIVDLGRLLVRVA